MLLCIIFYWHSPPQAAGVLIVRSVVKIIGWLFCRTSLMLSCYVATSCLLILPTVIDAPLNYYSIRIDIPHFSETGGARNMVRCWCLGRAGMTFLMLWRANTGGREKDREREKIKNAILKINEFDDVALNTYPWVSVWVVGHSALHLPKVRPSVSRSWLPFPPLVLSVCSWEYTMLSRYGEPYGRCVVL